jgi:hypothetical protein
MPSVAVFAAGALVLALVRYLRGTLTMPLRTLWLFLIFPVWGLGRDMWIENFG